MTFSRAVLFFAVFFVKAFYNGGQYPLRLCDSQSIINQKYQDQPTNLWDKICGHPSLRAVQRSAKLPKFATLTETGEKTVRLT